MNSSRIDRVIQNNSLKALKLSSSRVSPRSAKKDSLIMNHGPPEI